MIQLKRIRSRLAVFLGAATLCGVAAAIPAAASPASAQAAAGPVSVPAGPGCPAGMLAWLPGSAAQASGLPQAVAPGNLSPEAQASFGAQVLRLLAGQQVSWLGSTGCTQTLNQSGASQVAVPGGEVIPRASQPVALTTPAPNPLANWSGIESDAGKFTGASMTWTVPAPTTTATPAALSIWPGIGQGSNTDKLIQAGTQQSQGGATYAWTEVVPGEFQQQINGMSVAAGDNMAVNVAWDHSTGTAAFLVVNYSTHKAKEITDPVTGSSGSSAEWIAERTESCGGANCVPGIYPHLLKFGLLEIVNGAAEQVAPDGTTVTRYIGGFGSLFYDTMQACAGSPNLATPSGLDTQGDFLDTFDHPGTVVDPKGCAWTISPANAAFHGALAPNARAVLYDKAAALNIICQQDPVSGTTGANGSYPVVATITASAINACADANGGVWSAHPTSGSMWLLDGDSASLDGVMTGGITDISASMSGDVSGKTCSFTLAGDVPEGDATYTNPNALRITGASLAVSGVSGTGCGTAGVHNGDTFTLTADYTVTSSTGGIVLQPGTPGL